MSESIVVGTDGSDTAKRAVAEAVRLAKALGAQLHVVSAYEPLRGVRIEGAAEAAPFPTTSSTRRSHRRPRSGASLMWR